MVEALDAYFDFAEQLEPLPLINDPVAVYINERFNPIDGNEAYLQYRMIHMLEVLYNNLGGIMQVERHTQILGRTWYTWMKAFEIDIIKVSRAITSLPKVAATDTHPNSTFTRTAEDPPTKLIDIFKPEGYDLEPLDIGSEVAVDVK